MLLGTVVFTGCDFDVYKLPLPGGTDVGDDPMTVKVQFTDVLDLVPKTSVKVNDVSVGNVTDIELTGTHRDRDARAQEGRRPPRERDRGDPPDQPAR